MKYFSNISWLFFERILRMTSGLLVGIWVARYLGPEQFGVLSYSQSFVFIFSAFASLGLDSIVVRNLIAENNDKFLIISTAFILKILGSFVVLFFISIATWSISNDKYVNCMIFIIAISNFFISFNVVDFYFQSIVLNKYVAYANIVAVVLSSLFKILLVYFNASIIFFAFAILFDSIFVAACYCIIFVKYNTILSNKSTKFHKDIAISLLKDSWPLIIGSISVSLYTQSDQLIIKNIIGDEATGYYSVAARLSEAFLFLTTIVTSSVFPSIINAKKISNDLFLHRLQILYNLLIKIAFFISLFIFIFSDEIVNMLYGSGFSESSKILVVYVWSSVFVYLSNVSNLYYITNNIQFHTCLRLVVGSILNILLTILFIDLYGVIGAAYATLISYSVSSYFYNLFFVKTFDNFRLQTKSILNIFNLKTYKLSYLQKGIR